MYIYIHVYIQICMYICIHDFSEDDEDDLYIYIYIYIYIYTCVYTYMYVYMWYMIFQKMISMTNMCVHTYMYVYHVHVDYVRIYASMKHVSCVFQLPLACFVTLCVTDENWLLIRFLLTSNLKQKIQHDCDSRK
jgi:hypothetical protein